LTSKGQITVPKAIREHLEARTGDRLAFVIDENGGVRVELQNVDIGALQGLLAGKNRRQLSLHEMQEVIKNQARRRLEKGGRTRH
jgi:AbrB family looped-hinge helix DNA binding protein